MKITDPGADTVDAAANGSLEAIDAVLRAVQPGVFNLAVRMLGNRDDAADATQEILLKVVTHLGGFRREAAFTTWVFQIARNQLISASTRRRESPEVSLDAMGELLQAGLNFTATLGDPLGHNQSLTPEDKVAARQVALNCTQSMLMTLDREQRLAYLLDVVFGLSSVEAAEVLDINAAAYRQRLSRARDALDPFVHKTCGLANREADCRCEKQLPALKYQQATQSNVRPIKLVAVDRRELAEVQQHFDALVRMSDAAALFRAHPQYRASESLTGAIRAVLQTEGYWSTERQRPLQ